MHSSEIASRLLRKLLLIALPFIIYGAAVLMIDPFNFFSDQGLMSDTIKTEYSSKINTPLYLLAKYKKKPARHILLGDSRMGLMQPSSDSNQQGNSFFNLSYGASTINEIVSTFREVVKWQKPASVYVGLSLDLYNKMNNRNRVTGVAGMFSNPLLYFSSYNVLEGMYLVTKASIGSTKKPINLPDMDRTEFWDYQINTAGSRYFSNWVYPEEYYNDLREISEYCHLNGTKLVFVIFPTHVELQNLMDKYKLRDAEKRFIRDISGLAEVYNFNIPSEITTNRNNFDDPFHAKPEISRKVAEIIFSGNSLSDTFTHPLFIHSLPDTPRTTQ